MLELLLPAGSEVRLGMSDVKSMEIYDIGASEVVSIFAEWLEAFM
jgi:hypothetical protein